MQKTSNNKNDSVKIKMINDGLKIHLQESQKLMEPEKKRNSKLCIEFNDLCYSVCNNKGKFILSFVKVRLSCAINIY